MVSILTYNKINKLIQGMAETIEITLYYNERKLCYKM